MALLNLKTRGQLILYGLHKKEQMLKYARIFILVFMNKFGSDHVIKMFKVKLGS